MGLLDAWLDQRSAVWADLDDTTTKETTIRPDQIPWDNARIQEPTPRITNGVAPLNN
jgi:hypothetical protein